MPLFRYTLHDRRYGGQIDAGAVTAENKTKARAAIARSYAEDVPRDARASLCRSGTSGLCGRPAMTSNQQRAIAARPQWYARGREDRQAGGRFCPPDFRTDAAAAEAYRAGYYSDETQNKN